jgi:hypothetical protein
MRMSINSTHLLFNFIHNWVIFMKAMLDSIFIFALNLLKTDEREN